MRTLVIILAAGLLACQGGNSTIGPHVSLNFTARSAEGDTVIVNRLEAGTWTPVPFSVEGGAGSIIVTGYFVAGCSGQPLEASADRAAGQITLRIAPVRAKFCLDVPQPYSYEAYFTALEPDAYRLAVIHFADVLREGGHDRELVVVEQEVVVR